VDLVNRICKKNEKILFIVKSTAYPCGLAVISFAGKDMNTARQFGLDGTFMPSGRPAQARWPLAVKTGRP